MKEKAVAKINKFGKIGIVIGHIARVGLVIASILAVVIGIFMMSVDLLDMTYQSQIKVEVDKDAYFGLIGETFAEDMQESWDAEIMSGSLTMDDDVYSQVSVEQTEDGAVMTMATEPVAIFSPVKCIVFMVCTLIYLAAAFVSVTFIMKLCKEFRDCETPFSEAVIQRMKQVSISLIPWVVTAPFATASMNSLVTSSFDVTFELGSFVLVSIVFALTQIFKYGAVLQQESDETL